MPAIPAVIGAAVSIGGGLLSASAQKKAAKAGAQAQQQSSAEQIAFMKDIYAKNTTNEQPFLNSGYGALSVANQLLGLKPLTADQFNNGEWYLPGTVNYAAPAAPTASTDSATSTAGYNQALEGWSTGAIEAMRRNIHSPSTWAHANAIQNPHDRLQYLLSVSPASTDQHPLYAAYASSHPEPTNTSGSTNNSGGATAFTAAPAGYSSGLVQGPSPAPATSASNDQATIIAQANAAIASGADAAAVKARAAGLGVTL